MSRADASDPAIKAALQDVLNDGSETNWMLVGYAPKSNNKLQLIDKGTDGWSEMCEDLPEGKVQFGFCRFEIKNVFRYVYLAWCGEGVQGMMKGQFNNHVHDMQRFFQGFHVQVNARNEDDVEEADVIKKLTTAIGAAYEAGDTRGRGTGVTSVAQGRDAVTRAPVTKTTSTAPQIDKGASEQYWQQQQQEEQSRPKPAVPTTRNITVKSDAGGLRRQFEAKAAEQAPAKPAPVRTGKVWKPAPAAEPVAAAPPPRAAPRPAAAAPKPVVAAAAPPPVAPKPVVAAAPPPVAPKPVAAPPPPVPQYEETYDESGYDESGYDEGEGAYEGESYDEGEGAYEAEAAYDEGEGAYEAEAEAAYDEGGAEAEAEAAYDEGEGEAYDEGEGEAYDEGGYVGTARAMYDYNAENESDLSFAAGDIINIIDQSDPDGWWSGELNGATGYFPCNFVEQI